MPLLLESTLLLLAAAAIGFGAGWVIWAPRKH